MKSCYMSFRFSSKVGLIMASQSSSQEIQLTFKYVDGKFIPVVQKDLPIYESAMSSGSTGSGVFLVHTK